MSSLLQQAVALAKSGQREAAEELLSQVLTERPDDEGAWILLSGVTRNRALKREALSRALALNPDNALAQQGLERFGSHVGSSPPSVGPTPGISAPSGSVPGQTPPASAGAFMDVDAPEGAGSPTGAGAFEFEDTDDVASPSEPQPGAEMGGLFDFSDDAPFATDTPVSAEESPPGDEEPAFDFSAEFPFPLEAEDPSASFEASEDAAIPLQQGEASSTETDTPFDWGAFDLSAEPPAFSDDTLTEAEPGILDFEDEDEPPFNFEDEEPAAPDEVIADDQPDSIAGDRLANLFGGPIGTEDEAEPVEETGPSLDLKEAEPVFDWDSAPAFDFDAEFSMPSVKSPEPDQAEESGDDWAARIAQEGDSQPSDILEGLDDATRAALLRERQKRQQNILIAATVLFVLAVICLAGLVVFDNQVGRYAILPPPAQISREAPNPNSAGQARLNFNGFPGSRARIEWTQANDAETCLAPGMGLEVDFGAIAPSSISNQACRGDSCAFEKELNQAPVSQATVTYICGKEATVTLFR